MTLIEEALSLMEEARTKRTPACLELYEEAGKRLVAEVEGLQSELVDTGTKLEAAEKRIEELLVENRELERDLQLRLGPRRG
jgi:hypothetical protein